MTCPSASNVGVQSLESWLMWTVVGLPRGELEYGFLVKITFSDQIKVSRDGKHVSPRGLEGTSSMWLTLSSRIGLGENKHSPIGCSL